MGVNYTQRMLRQNTAPQLSSKENPNKKKDYENIFKKLRFAICSQMKIQTTQRQKANFQIPYTATFLILSKRAKMITTIDISLNSLDS